MIFNFLFALALFNFITPVNDKTLELNNNTCSVCRDTVWVIEEMNHYHANAVKVNEWGAIYTREKNVKLLLKI